MLKTAGGEECEQHSVKFVLHSRAAMSGANSGRKRHFLASTAADAALELSVAGEGAFSW